MRIFYSPALQKLFFIFCLVYSLDAHSQQVPEFNWALQFGGESQDIGHIVARDASGNIYIAGSFQHTIDFDPGPGISELNSPDNIDIFILKLDPAGHFIWVKQFANSDYLCASRVNGMVINSSGEIYMTGYFQGTVDFDPGPGTLNLSENYFTAPNCFVVKLDVDGNLIWAEKFDAEVGTSITMDSNQWLLITGVFENTADFDPGPGYYPLTETNGEFVMRLKPNGDLSWARAIESNYSFGDNATYTIAADQNNNVYVTGSFSGTIDCDPGPGVFNMSAGGTLLGQNSYLMKLDDAGNFIWAKQIAAGADNKATAMVTRSDGHVFIGGNYSGPGDFDPGPGTFIMTSGSYDGFLMEVDPDGNFIQAKQFKGTATNAATYINRLRLDTDNNIFVAGYFLGPGVDFDPGPGFYPVGTLNYSSDAFILKLTSTGDFIWVRTVADHPGAGMPGTEQRCNDMIVDPGGSIYFTGEFWTSTTTVIPNSGTADFDPCVGFYDMTPVSGQDVFIARWDQFTPGNASVTITPGVTGSCTGANITFTATATNAGILPGYQWQVNGVNTGTNSNTYSSSTLNNGDQVQLIMTTNGDCTSAVSVQSNIVVVNISNPVTASVDISSSATSICAGELVTFTATTVNPGSNPVYQWKKNSVDVGTNSPAYTDNSIANGDVLQCILISNAACITTATVTSNSITMTVSPVQTATLDISASSTEICAGTTVTFTANTTNSGIGPLYQWKRNGVSAGNNSPVYSDNNLSNGDNISCDLTPDGNCIVPVTLSASVSIIVHPLPDVTITASATQVAEGSTAVLTANSSANQFAWYYNGTLIAGSSGNTVTADHDHPGEYYVTVTDVYGCSNSSNKILIIDSLSTFPFITPNPNNGAFIVRFPNNENNSTRYITIWDSKGAKVYSSGFVVASADGKILLDLKYLSGGTYFLQLSDKNKKRLKAGKVVIK